MLESSLQMRDWLRKLRGKMPEPLTGAPQVRRQKTYSAQSGYVYVYRYAGCREVIRDSDPAVEYVFEVSPDRAAFERVSVFVSPAALAAWEDEHHSLNPNERFAIAKMALFQAFDEREEPRQMRQAILVRRADAESILEMLGID